MSVEPGLLAGQPWLTSESTVQLVQAFGKAPMRFVGGCVRDALLGHEVHDIDCATPLPPQEVMALLRAASIACVPTGVAHGTVTAIVDRISYEITTLRRDEQCDGRHAQVAFTEDWEQDALRRDFTMNALYCDVTGHVYDMVGGIEDARAGRVRFIGDAVQRIHEDALRILRFFRFYASHGKGDADVQALTACAAQAALLERLSAERIQHEMRKLFAAVQPYDALVLMHRHGVLGHVAPGVMPAEALRHLAVLEAAGAPRHPWVRMALCLRAGGADAASLSRRWKCATRDAAWLERLCTSPALALSGSEADMRHVVHRYGNALAAELWLRDAAERGDEVCEALAQHRALLAMAVPQFPVQGADMVARGWPEGKALGEALARLQRLWQESDFTLSKQELLEQLPNG